MADKQQHNEFGDAVAGRPSLDTGHACPWLATRRHDDCSHPLIEFILRAYHVHTIHAGELIERTDAGR